jgi:hypothetical protein
MSDESDAESISNIIASSYSPDFLLETSTMNTRIN